MTVNNYHNYKFSYLDYLKNKSYIILIFFLRRTGNRLICHITFCFIVRVLKNPVDLPILKCQVVDNRFQTLKPKYIG